jgi:hypothetical protein
MQITFSRLWDGYATDKEAMKARNKKAKELKSLGYNVYCTRLTNQLKPYSSLGCPDGRSCTVYMLGYEEKNK